MMMIKSIAALAVAVQAVAANMILTAVFKDDKCTVPVGVNYFNNMQSTAGLPAFGECIKPSDPSVGSGLVLNQPNPVTLLNFPNLNNTAKLASALWNNSDCSGIPTVVTVYYLDTTKLKAQCNNNTLVAVNGNQTQTQSAGCQASNGSSAMFRCLIPDPSLPTNTSTAAPKPTTPPTPPAAKSGAADDKAGVGLLSGALLAGAALLMA